ncbi:MAG TPA: hypothetical protein VLA21_03265 [Candidatus Limnocylindria bacterium]|nr:hypothetical protein [Candidatus Limnocylindria bacterium]
MKKIVSVLVVALVLTAMASALAAPVVPPQSLGNVSPNAAEGIHTACMLVHENAQGRAHEIFELRLCIHH